jgi:hypothetical protein
MTTVFADSFFFFALNSTRDAHHRKAVHFVENFTGRIWTTSQVLTELGDGMCHPDNRDSFPLTVKSSEHSGRSSASSTSCSLAHGRPGTSHGPVVRVTMAWQSFRADGSTS